MEGGHNMSNMYANRLTIEADNAEEIIKSLLKICDYGDEADIDFNKIIKMPKSVKSSDKTEWAKKHWGCKDNAINTAVYLDRGVIEFETPWCHCLPVVEKLAEQNPGAVITYEYSSEEAGYDVGKNVYIHGHLMIVVEMESFTKEAYEQYFDLCGEDENFVYDEEKGTYILRG